MWTISRRHQCNCNRQTHHVRINLKPFHSSNFNQRLWGPWSADIILTSHSTNQPNPLFDQIYTKPHLSACFSFCNFGIHLTEKNEPSIQVYWSIQLTTPMTTTNPSLICNNVVVNKFQRLATKIRKIVNKCMDTALCSPQNICNFLIRLMHKRFYLECNW